MLEFVEMGSASSSVNVPNDTEFAPADLKEVTGLTYKQLNGWDKKGALPTDEQRGEKWRKFTPRMAFTAAVCSELRKRFNFPLESLVKIKAYMLQEGADHFSYAVEVMSTGFAVWLLVTPDADVFIMDTDTEFEDMFQSGFLRSRKIGGFTFLHINPLVNRVLSCLKEPIELSICPKIYEQIDEAKRAMRSRNNQEFQLLQFVRQPEVESVTANLKGGEITELFVDEELKKPDDAIDENLSLKTLMTSGYQTLTVKNHGGQVARLNRRTPIKFPKLKATGKPPEL